MTFVCQNCTVNRIEFSWLSRIFILTLGKTISEPTFFDLFCFFCPLTSQQSSTALRCVFCYVYEFGFGGDAECCFHWFCNININNNSIISPNVFVIFPLSFRCCKRLVSNEEEANVVCMLIARSLVSFVFVCHFNFVAGTKAGLSLVCSLYRMSLCVCLCDSWPSSVSSFRIIESEHIHTSIWMYAQLCGIHQRRGVFPKDR